MPAKVSPAEITMATPLADVRGVGPTRADALARLGLKTVADLVRHLPLRYERHEAESTIDRLAPGAIGSAKGEITATRVAGGGKRPRFEAVMLDHTGRLDLVWFNMTHLKNRLIPGLTVRVHGQANPRGPGLQMVNPKFEIVTDDPIPDAPEPPADGAPGEAGAPGGGAGPTIRPVYPASEHINSAAIEKLVGEVIDKAVTLIPEHLPEAFRRARSLPALGEAYRMAHRPASLEEAREAVRRLAYDELLLLQLGVFLRREQLRRTVRAVPLRFTAEIDDRIRQRFPFPLTGAQERVVSEIVHDLTSDDPANRLIQGDVGSGKTVVALYAMLLAVASGHQAALMAPTELLAEQHYSSMSRMLEGSNVRLEPLTGALPAAEKADVLRRTASGEVGILVGTHALLTERVRFNSLAVVVIDEQHRFGVHQRAVLREKGTGGAEDGGGGPAGGQGGMGAGERERLFAGTPSSGGPSAADAATAAGSSRPPAPQPPRPLAASAFPAERPLAPHVLVMTATPIPRTLALTLLGDLEVSTIDELPPGRTPIVTRVVPPAASAEVYRWVRQRLDAGEQAYIVVPAIDSGASTAGEGGDSELNDLRTVLARLENGELMGKRLAALHGRLKRDTREAVMARFRAGQIDALVATTVIEVGVDVPNATVMVVEHAERFGLAQLHQLRGRVGRGSKRSVCVLIGDPTTPDAESRLGVMAATADGFELAEKDLEIRGPGEVFGLRQAGAPPFRVADLMRDRDLLALARRDAQQWIERSPVLDRPEEKVLRTRLLRTHGAWLGLGDVA
jgi:ATP-dependent DNA helicase RecG